MPDSIDLRSDTVTTPTAAMRRAMAEAPVGDDVYGDDPSVNRLEALGAEMFGHEAALFAPSGTQTNLLALLTHCGRGDEYIVGHDAHTYKYEGGGAAVLGGIQPQPVTFATDGTLPLDQVESVIKPDDFHFARTRLLCLENTQHGRVLPLDYFPKARALCDQHGLALHLDGARIGNAAVALGVAPIEISHHFDSVSVCLSKGLCAPVGSLLCGGRDFIREARRWRKVLGGGMRQAGVLAAAGALALTEQLDRLADDHANAVLLAELLADVEALAIRSDWLQTNMLWIDLADAHRESLAAHCAKSGVLISPGRGVLRLVTHKDVSEAGVRRAAAVIRDYFASASANSR
jgi:threonine aldolase